VKKSASVWSRHSCSANWTTATFYSQAFLSRPSESAACTERRCSSHHCDTKPRDYITPVLMRLHWLPIKSRILYKQCLLIHLIHTNQRPAYMAEMVELTATSSSRSVQRVQTGLPDTYCTGSQHRKSSSVSQVSHAGRPCCLEQSARLYSV